MATQAIQPNDGYDRLDSTIQSWENRLRLKRILLWLPFSLVPGLTIGVILAVLSRMQPLLTATQISTIAAGLTLLGGVGLIVGIRYWRRSPIRSARYFDLEFGLKERVSTALEIINGRIRTVEDIRDRQLVDAINIATTIQPRDAIELVIVRRHWVPPLVTFLLLGFLLILPNPQEDAIASNPQQQTAIADAANQVRDITEMVASDTTLTDEQRDSLIETLETNLETLQDENITSDEAFASTSQVQSALEEQSAELNTQANEQEQGLEQGNQALEESAPPPPSESGEPQGGAESGDESGDQSGDPSGEEQTPGENFNETINQVSENLENMTQAEREQAADALDQAADATRESNPDVSNALQDAAEAVRNQDTQAAQEALSDAQQSISEAQEQINQTRESAQNMQEAAQEAQQSANDIANSTQPEGEQSDGQQQQESQQQSSSPPDDSETQQSNDSQSGNTSTDSETTQDGQQGQQQTDTQRGVESADTQQTSGDVSSGDRPDGVGQSEQQISQQNNPDGQGVSDYDPIYAPQRLGGESTGPEIVLDPDVSDETLREVDVTDDPSGVSIVPYSQVFADYSSAASRALDNDYVPLGLRDVIRDYFTSLDPQRSQR